MKEKLTTNKLKNRQTILNLCSLYIQNWIRYFGCQRLILVNMQQIIEAQKIVATKHHRYHKNNNIQRQNQDFQIQGSDHGVGEGHLVASKDIVKISEHGCGIGSLQASPAHSVELPNRSFGSTNPQHDKLSYDESRWRLVPKASPSPSDPVSKSVAPPGQSSPRS